MLTRISQSFIKDFQSYIRQEDCGLIFRAKHVEGKLFDSDGSMALGSWFEFKATGAIPKNGVEPKPVMMDSGKDMNVKYRVALKNAVRLKGNPEMGIKGMLSEMGLKVIGVQKHIVKGRFEGTLDLVVMVIKNHRFVQQTEDPENPIIIRWRKGDKFWIDLKYSGLLDDRWSKHGWAWSQIQKEYHGIQAKQYTFLSGLPGYFMVWQSNNAEADISDVRLFHVPVTPEDIEVHIAKGNDYFERFEVMARADLFQPYPEIKRCHKCPLKDNCKFKRNFPHPVTIKL